jgi:hypothetical protein
VLLSLSKTDFMNSLPISVHGPPHKIINGAFG